MKAFILTRQWRDAEDGLRLIYWVRAATGPVQVEVRQQEAVCFVESEQLPQAQALLGSRKGIRFSALALKSFNNRPVHGVYFKGQRQLLAVRGELSRAGIGLLEADIRPTDRFLMERFVTGSVLLQGVERFDSVASEAPLMTDPTFRPCDHDPVFSVVSLDIETSMDGKQLFSIAVAMGQQRQVFMVGSASEVTTPECMLTLVPDERALLTCFLEWMQVNDPDLMVGWNVVNFDLRFLQQKCDKLGVSFRIGRNQQRVEWRQSRGNEGRYFIVVPGRVVLDGIDTLKAATYNFESFSLEFVSQQLLGRGKLLDSADDIQQLFVTDKIGLARYNIEDCQLVLDVFEKAQLLHFVIERSQLTGLPLDKTGGSVAAFENLYLPRLHRKGYVAPNLGALNSEIEAPGGYVMEPLPGLYRDVLVLDFKSLYPSIIRTFRIDPLSLIFSLHLLGENKAINPAIFGQSSILSLAGDVPKDIKEAIPGFNGAFFSKTEHLLPDIIEHLWQARDKAKNEKNAPLSQAIKIIMNSFYGVLGTPLCRFYDPRLSSSITLRGHDILQQTRLLIEQQGYQVIYGDTDSVFVWLKEERSVDQVKNIGSELVRYLNAWWQQALKQRFGLESFLEIEFETHFSRFVMPRMRGSDQGSKKRYAGLIQATSSNEQDRLVFKGLENVRTDWTPLARDVQKTLYWNVLHDEPFEDYLKDIHQRVILGELDQQLVFRKRIRRRLKDYQKNIPPHVQAAKKAERWREAQGKPLAYQQGGWIEYVMTVNGPEPMECVESQLDYEFYIERQLAPAVDGLLSFLETSLGRLVDQQIDLF